MSLEEKTSSWKWSKSDSVASSVILAGLLTFGGFQYQIRNENLPERMKQKLTEFTDYEGYTKLVNRNNRFVLLSMLGIGLSLAGGFYFVSKAIDNEKYTPCQYDVPY